MTARPPESCVLAKDRPEEPLVPVVSPGPLVPVADFGPLDRLRGWIVTGLITLLATVTRFLNLGSLTDAGTPIFDEKHYAPQAWQVLNNHGVEDNPGYGLVVHPPVGKQLIAIGEAIFGYNGFGWRFTGALLGVVLVALVVRIVRRISRSTLVGAIAGVLLICEIENGLDPTMYGGDNAFAQMVDQTLTNPKGWTHNPQFAFVRIDSGKPDFRISLVSPTTVRGGCGYEFRLETSCYNPSFGGMDRQSRVFINEARWVRGAVPFEGDVGSYRQYVINHEVGHAIGYLRHEPCDQQGGLAPVMMQQTFSTSNDDAAKFDPDFVKADGKTCRFNPWPYPIP